MEGAGDKILVHVDAQRCQIPSHTYTGKIKCPGAQIRFLLEHRHFIFERS